MTAPFDQRSLEPLIQALLRRARHDADDVLAQADAEVAAVLQRAEAEADRILAAARERGAADGSASAAATRAGAQRRARSVLLDARRAAAEDERRAAREAVRTLMDDAEYPAVRAALVARARSELGADAVIADLAQGGVRATAAGRSIRYALDDLADELLARQPAPGKAAPA
jgi:vacuolar-type H+-ATPase subunit E/Vma4